MPDTLTREGMRVKFEASDLVGGARISTLWAGAETA